jgi:hypothetical protein
MRVAVQPLFVVWGRSGSHATRNLLARFCTALPAPLVAELESTFQELERYLA